MYGLCKKHYEKLTKTDHKLYEAVILDFTNFSYDR